MQPTYKLYTKELKSYANQVPCFVKPSLEIVREWSNHQEGQR